MIQAIAKNAKLGRFTTHMIEDAGSPHQYRCKDICEKFDTAINRFMSVDFKEIYLNPRVKYKDIKLYLVTNAYREAMQHRNFKEYLMIRSKVNQKDTLVNDMALASKNYVFRGKSYVIEREIPPNPVICRIL